MRSWGVKAFRRSFVLVLLVGSAMGQTSPGNPDSTKPISSTQSAVSSGQALIKSGKFSEAATIFRQIIAGDVTAGDSSGNNRPQLQSVPEAYAGLVRSLLKLDDVAGAEEAAAMGVRAYPQSSIALAARGDVRFRNGGISMVTTSRR